MPAGGGSGEGGLAARGYGGVAQPGGNYGGTNVVGTGGGFLGDRSAINAAAQQTQYYANGQPVRNTLPKPAVKPKPMPVVKIVKDPMTGQLIAVDDVTGAPIPNYDFNMPYNPEPWDNYPLGGNPIPGKSIYDRVPISGGGSGTGPGGMFGGSPTPGQPGAGIDLSGSGGHNDIPGSFGGFQGQPNPSNDGVAGAITGDANRMMMAPGGEQPMVSPGPMGPEGHPMGNRPPFRVGSNNLALMHDQWRRRAMMDAMRQRMQGRMRPERLERPERPNLGGRMNEAQQLRRALRRERRRT